MPVETLILGTALAAATVGGGLAYFFLSTKKDKKSSQDTEEAKTKARQIILDAKDEALKIKSEAEKEIQKTRQETLELEKKSEKRLDEAYAKLKELDDSERTLENLKEALMAKKEEIENIHARQTEKLQSIASMTKEEGKELLLKDLEKTLENETAKKLKEADQKVRDGIDEKARELLIETMHNASTDYVAEYTISTIKLADRDLKGRIIGKEGRNIKAFEDATGVNVDFEDDNEIRLSSFDSVRREIARVAMEKLIKDGRIHPARIEEIVEKTQKEVDKLITQAGEDLCKTVDVYNLPPELVNKLGHFKYRTSYGQNMIQHTLEETKMGAKIANEIGADVTVTKLACLLHDIGKVITDKEGNHIELGAQYLKKFDLPKEVITAVAEHHDDKPSTLEGVIVQIADSISGSRPGARYEDYENYLQRMRQLEEAATSFKGIARAFAISAGRELRVIVQPEEISDAKATTLAHDIARKIEAQQRFPGTVKVIVIRETRSTATAS